MPSAASTAYDFIVVLSQIKEGSRLDGAIQSLSQSFSIPLAEVRSSLASTPVVLFERMSRDDVDGIKDRLLTLSKLGLDFKITKKLTNDIPRTGWKLRNNGPSNAHAAPASTPAQGPQMHISCPHCQKSFVLNFQVAQAAPAAAAVAAPPSPAPAPAAAPPAPASTQELEDAFADFEAIPIEDPATLFDSGQMIASDATAVEADDTGLEEWEIEEPSAPAAAAPPADDLEEIEELGDLEELDELDEAPRAPAPPPDPASGLDDLEEIEDIDLESSAHLPSDDSGDIEEIEEIEELAASAPDDLEELEELDEISAASDDDLDLESAVGAIEEEISRPAPAADPLDELDELSDLEDLEIDTNVVNVEDDGDVEEIEAIAEVEDELDRIDELELDSEIENMPTIKGAPIAVPAAAADEDEFELASDSAEALEIDDVELDSQVADVEDVEEIEDVEEVDELDDFSGLDEISEIDEFDDAPAAKPAPAKAPPPARAAAQDDLDDLEDLEDLDDISGIEAIEPSSRLEAVEEIDDISEVDEVSEFESIEEVDELEAVEEVEEVEDVEAVEALDDFDDLSEIDDISEIDEDEPPARKAAPAGSAKKSAKEVSVEEEELEPWTGRARDYKPKTTSSPRGKDAKPKKEVIPLDDDAIVDEDDLPPQKGKLDLKKKGSKSAAARTETARPKAAAAIEGLPEMKEGQYSVFLQKITNPEQKKKVVPLLCELRGIESDEAEDLCDRMIVPVLKGVSKEFADEVLKKFKSMGVNGRAPKMAPGKR